MSRNAVEVTCNEHKEDENIHVYCEWCLKSYLNANKDACPINNNHKCTFNANRYMRVQILKLKVRCPNADLRMGGDNIEGRVENTQGNKGYEMEKGCHWKGTIQVKIKTY